MSPTGDFLASAHVDDLGIYLWYVIFISVKNFKWGRMLSTTVMANVCISRALSSFLLKD